MPITRRDAALFAALAVAAVLLALIGFGVIRFTSSNPWDVEDVRSLPSEFLRAVYYANKTSNSLSLLLDGLPPQGLPAKGAAARTAETIRRIVSDLDPSTPMGKWLANTGEAYASLAEAAENASTAARKLGAVLTGLRQVFRDIEVCNITGFINSYEAVRNTTLEAKDALKDSLVRLASIDPDSLASPEHRYTYRELNRTVSLLVLALDKLDRFYLYARENPGIAEKLCQLAKKNGLGAGMDEKRSAAELLSRIGAEHGSGKCRLASSGLAHSLAELINGLKKALGETGTTTPGAEGQSGQGAGYGKPESDD